MYMPGVLIQRDISRNYGCLKGLITYGSCSTLDTPSKIFQYDDWLVSDREPLLKKILSINSFISTKTTQTIENLTSNMILESYS